MESLNLNNLASSLPSSSYANAEKELTNNFKAAALSLTTLFRSSKTASKRAYNAGYAAACHDLLNMIQQGVSTHGDAGHEVSIGRIMDYIEARLEALRAREEEEDEEEERAAKGVAGPSKTKPSSPTLPPAPAARRDHIAIAPPTPYTPSSLDHRSTVPNVLSSPTPSVLPLRPLTSQPNQQLPLRASKLKPPSSLSVNPKDLSTIPLPSAPMSFTFDPPAIADLTVPYLGLDRDLASRPPATATTLTKRRREAAAADSGSAPPEGAPVGGVPGTSRRRTRSSREHNYLSAQSDDMDVEDEGPQRKRVARR